MHVSFVPIVPHTTVINKNIIYSDTVLNLKDSGNSIKITSISNVSKDSLEECLRTIFEANKDVVFNTVQYSKENKKIYFYTDEEVDTKVWEGKQYIKLNYASNSKEILEHIKEILEKEEIRDLEYISLYEVLKIYKKAHDNIDSHEKRINEIVQSIVKDKNYSWYFSCLHGYDYDKEQLHLSIWTKGNSSDSQSYYFRKRNDDLYVSEKTKGAYLYEDLDGEIDEKLSSLIDYYENVRPICEQKSDNIPIINSSLKAYINYYGIDLYIGNCLLSSPFYIEWRTHNGSIKTNINSSNTNKLIRDNQTELLKKIYVKIKDCPIWTQEILQNIRQDQLIKEEQEEQKKQKRLERKKRFFFHKYN